MSLFAYVCRNGASQGLYVHMTAYNRQTRTYIRASSRIRIQIPILDHTAIRTDGKVRLDKTFMHFLFRMGSNDDILLHHSFQLWFGISH